MTQLATDVPAIAGGRPIKSTPYRKEKRYGEEEMKELREAIDQGTLFYAGGKKVKELGKQFTERDASRHGIECSSWTAANHTACMAAGDSRSDDGIDPPLPDMGATIPGLWPGAPPAGV